MKFLLNKIFNLIYPRRCALCDRTLLRNEEGLCNECREKLPKTKKNVCVVCGREVENYKEKCESCSKHRHGFIGGRHALSYDLFCESIYRFKYMNRTEYAKFYAESIYNAWSGWIKDINADALVPVPLHKKRFRKRGYNQAAVLGRELSKLSGIPCYEDYVERTRNTKPQKYFDDKTRQINVKKAFIVTGNSVKLEKVIVVDDIFTTGSTIDAVVQALKGVGVKEVYFLTISASQT